MYILAIKSQKVATANPNKLWESMHAHVLCCSYKYLSLVHRVDEDAHQYPWMLVGAAIIRQYLALYIATAGAVKQGQVKSHVDVLYSGPISNLVAQPLGRWWRLDPEQT